jgi:hypothetical protein
MHTRLARWNTSEHNVVAEHGLECMHNMQTHIQMYVYIHTCTHTEICIYSKFHCFRDMVNLAIHTHTHTHIHACASTHTNTHTHTHTHCRLSASLRWLTSASSTTLSTSWDALSPRRTTFRHSPLVRPCMPHAASGLGTTGRPSSRSLTATCANTTPTTLKFHASEVLIDFLCYVKVGICDMREENCIRDVRAVKAAPAHVLSLCTPVMYLLVDSGCMYISR